MTTVCLYFVKFNLKIYSIFLATRAIGPCQDEGANAGLLPKVVLEMNCFTSLNLNLNSLGWGGCTPPDLYLYTPLLYTLIYLGPKGIVIVAVCCCFVLDYVRKIYVKKSNERQKTEKMRDEEARVRENKKRFLRQCLFSSCHALSKVENTQ